MGTQASKHQHERLQRDSTEGGWLEQYSSSCAVNRRPYSWDPKHAGTNFLQVG